MFARSQIWVYNCECEKCGNIWVALKDSLPKVCAKCKNPKWNSKKESIDKKIGEIIQKGIEGQIFEKEDTEIDENFIFD